MPALFRPQLEWIARLMTTGARPDVLDLAAVSPLLEAAPAPTVATPQTSFDAPAATYLIPLCGVDANGNPLNDGFARVVTAVSVTNRRVGGAVTARIVKALPGGRRITVHEEVVPVAVSATQPTLRNLMIGTMIAEASAGIYVQIVSVGGSESARPVTVASSHYRQRAGLQLP